MTAKILLVEDDHIIAKMYEDVLVHEKYEVVVAKTGVEAFPLIKSFQPDLILLDIMLSGGMNGFDILEQINRDERLKQIPVIVLTNLDSERKSALDLGAKDYILKVDKNPYEVVEIIKKNIKANSPN